MFLTVLSQSYQQQIQENHVNNTHQVNWPECKRFPLTISFTSKLVSSQYFNYKHNFILFYNIYIENIYIYIDIDIEFFFELFFFWIF